MNEVTPPARLSDEKAHEFVEPAIDVVSWCAARFEGKPFCGKPASDPIHRMERKDIVCMVQTGCFSVCGSILPCAIHSTAPAEPQKAEIPSLRAEIERLKGERDDAREWAKVWEASCKREQDKALDLQSQLAEARADAELEGIRTLEALDRRDDEWWEALAGVPGVAPRPADVKEWVLHVQDLALSSALSRERGLREAIKAWDLAHSRQCPCCDEGFEVGYCLCAEIQEATQAADVALRAALQQAAPDTPIDSGS